jgi:methionyl-tRNA formyltransferase
MRLVFAGTPQVALPALDAIHRSRHEVAAVVTRPDAPSGRGRGLERSAVGRWADDHGIDVLAPASARDASFADEIRALAPDCCPVVAYGALLPESLLAIPAHGWVNLHFSLLPAWRGAAPVQWAILAGDDVTGATTFRIGPGLDDGPVLGTLTETIALDDTAGTLLERLALHGATLLVHTLDAIEDGTITAIPQPAQGVSHAPKITVDDARIRWGDPARAVDRRIRAVTPAPGAWTMVGDERIGIGPCAVPAEAAPTGLEPGEVHATKREVWVGTGTTPVLLGEVRPAGKRAMPAADWARGLRMERLRFA